MNERLKSDSFLIGLLAAVVSVCACCWYYSTGELLLYGDAVAHINIARRVIDSLTPGWEQLGTVWLPLPHLLSLPLIWIDPLWRTGLAASIPSMLAYVVGTVGILHLGRFVASPAAGRIAAVIFAANPNIVYMQATGMTESIYLAAMIWSVAWFADFALAVRANDEGSARRLLYKCAFAVLAAVFTRYDGWFLGGFIALGGIMVWWMAHPEVRRQLARPLRNFLLLLAIGPAAWLAYNYKIFSNPFEFATGPYSARGIAERTTRSGDPPHPGHRHVQTAALYFLRAGRLNLGEGKREWWLLTIALIGTLLALPDRRKWPALLLWLVVPFYMLSMAYGGVPIFIPPWWPFSYYNVRYGLQLLPAVALFCGVCYAVLRPVVQNRGAQRSILLLLIGAVGGSYVSVWKAAPICLREARVNAVTRVRFETALAGELRKLPTTSTFLMYTGNHVGALQDAGIHLKRVANESNYLIWERALANPSAAADYVIATEGDPVARAVEGHPHGLTPLVRVATEGKPPAVIYRTAPE